MPSFVRVVTVGFKDQPCLQSQSIMERIFQLSLLLCICWCLGAIYAPPGEMLMIYHSMEFTVIQVRGMHIIYLQIVRYALLASIRPMELSIIQISCVKREASRTCLWVQASRSILIKRWLHTSNHQIDLAGWGSDRVLCGRGLHRPSFFHRITSIHRPQF